METPGTMNTYYVVIQFLFHHNKNVADRTRSDCGPQKGGMLGRIEGALYMQDVTSQADDAYWAAQEEGQTLC